MSYFSRVNSLKFKLFSPIEWSILLQEFKKWTFFLSSIYLRVSKISIRTIIFMWQINMSWKVRSSSERTQSRRKIALLFMLLQNHLEQELIQPNTITLTFRPIANKSCLYLTTAALNMMISAISNECGGICPLVTQIND